MRNQAVAGAVVAALLAWFDIVGCAQCVAYCWPYFGLKSFLIAGIIRSKYKNERRINLFCFWMLHVGAWCGWFLHLLFET